MRSSEPFICPDLQSPHPQEGTSHLAIVRLMRECKLADDLLNDQMNASLIISQSKLLDNLLDIQCCNLCVQA